MNVMDKSTVRSRKRYPRTLSPTNFDNILPSKPMNTDQSICSSKTTATYYSFEKNAQQSIILRDKEINQIQKVLSQFRIDRKKAYRILLVVGGPGGGKSMALRHLLKSKQNVIYLSANIFPTLKQITRQMLQYSKVETSDSLVSEKEEETISVFNKSKKSPAIVFIEELESIVEKSKNLEEFNQFIKIFESESWEGLNKPILVGTSNYLCLGQKIRDKCGITEDSIKQIAFSPYEVEELGLIIEGKIRQLKRWSNKEIFLEKKNIKYIANKISENKKGDARVVLELMKTLVMKPLIKSDSKNLEISFDAIVKALNQLFNPHETLLSKQSKKCQILVIALYNYIKLTDSLYVPYQKAIESCKEIYDSLKIKLEENEVDKNLEELEGYGIVRKTHKNKSKNNRSSKIALKVNLTEVQTLFKQDQVLARFVCPP